VSCPFALAAPSRLQYYVVCHPDRHDEPAVAALRHWLREAARETVADLPALIARSARGG
jgi:DNA-binding transcriptional LysR family regulator